MSKRAVWAPLVLGLGFGLASAHCGTTPRPPCSEDLDCDRFPWTEPGCEEDEGHWECLGGQCVALCTVEECTVPSDCAGGWTESCSGHFACSSGACEQVCETQTCGDDTCDVEGGETRASCPADCEAPCAIAANCIEDHEWDVPCEGRWACQTETCVPVCDYDSCGDGTCSPGEGENADSCPGDCVDGCRPLVPSDCFSELWAPPAICQGRWSCLPTGVCDRVCDHINCGDGICWGLNGENEDSCFEDCLGGPCQELTDCLGQRWYDPDHVPCQGHWECVPPSQMNQLATGACEAVCDDDPGGGCGDGTCDTLNGETPTSCLVDCGAGYSCTKSGDCDSLALPDGCAGAWICSSQLCVPQCE